MINIKELCEKINEECKYIQSVKCAIKHGNPNIIKVLLIHASDNIVSNSICVVTDACRYGQIECIDFLLSDSRIDIKRRDEYIIALSNACIGKHTSAIKMLLSHPVCKSLTSARPFSIMFIVTEMNISSKCFYHIKLI